MRATYALAILGLLSGSLLAQTPDTDNTPTILGIFPNHRTVAESKMYMPISAEEKWQIARRDSFSLPILVQSSGYAAIDQWRDKDPSYGQGAEGFGRRLGANIADRATEHLMTQGFFPMGSRY